MTDDSLYIDHLRNNYRMLDVINLLHLSAIGTGGYFLSDLAERFGSVRSNLNTSMIRLRANGLIRYEKHGSAGIYLWFIKDSFDAKWDMDKFPQWRLVDHSMPNKPIIRIKLGEQERFARDWHLHGKTVRAFLGGKTKTLNHRWTVQSSPASQYA